MTTKIRIQATVAMGIAPEKESNQYQPRRRRKDYIDVC
jgi:hypothetical protein